MSNKKMIHTIRSFWMVIPLLYLCLAGPSAFSSEMTGSCCDPVAKRDMSPQATDEEIAELVSGNAAFTFDLYHEILKYNDGNIFYSPYSISLALAMTYAGARGETGEQMAETLHYTLPQNKLHPAFNTLDLILASRGEPDEWSESDGFKLNIANSLWGQTGYKFMDEFLNLLGTNYGAGIKLVDFTGNPDASRIKINEWVEDQTEDRIKNLLSPGTVDALTRLILVNAIYFNAAWAHPFKERNTEDDFFYPLEGDAMMVPMMTQEESFRVNIGDNYKAILIQYDGRKLSMAVIIPDEGKFAEIENSIDADFVATVLNGMSSYEVILTMPKFTYESGFGLRETLSAMGMQVAFDPMGADFSGMDGTRSLFIYNVIHKAFIKVDEEGTEAAAATAVMMELTMAPEEEPEPIEIRIDRPFIFLIRDNQTGAILFVGRVVNPNPD